MSLQTVLNGALAYSLLINVWIVSSPCHSQPVILNSIFDKVTLGGERMVLSETLLNVKRFGSCAMECSNRRSQDPVCVAFSYVPLDEICSIYKYHWIQHGASTMEVYLWQARGIFHTIHLNGNIYNVYSSQGKYDYRAGRAHCQSMGGYLLELNSLEEYDAVWAVISGLVEIRWWVGANDLDNEGVWVTDRDNQPLDTNTVWLWGSTEPDARSWDEDGAMLKLSGGQIEICDVRYTDSLNVLCERDA